MKLILITVPIRAKDWTRLIRIAEGKQFITHNAKLWVVPEATKQSPDIHYTLARESQGEKDSHLPLAYFPLTKCMSVNEFEQMMMDRFPKSSRKLLTLKRS